MVLAYEFNVSLAAGRSEKLTRMYGRSGDEKSLSVVFVVVRSVRCAPNPVTVQQFWNTTDTTNHDEHEVLIMKNQASRSRPIYLMRFLANAQAGYPRRIRQEKLCCSRLHVCQAWPVPVQLHRGVSFYFTQLRKVSPLLVCNLIDKESE